MKVQKQIQKAPVHYLLALAAVDEVDRLYPTEKACMRQIWRRIRKEKRCQFCSSRKLKLTDCRTGNCGSCGKMFWLTAGTTFDRIRSARPYLIAIHLVEKCIPFSARMLSRLCSIAYASALAIFKKIMGAVWLAMPSSVALVSSFEFDDAICKRSFETEARKHPISEQENLLVDSLSSSGLNASILESGLPSMSRIATAEDGLETDVTEEVKVDSGLVQFEAAQFAPSTGCETSALPASRSQDHTNSVEEIVYNVLTYEAQTIDSLVSATRLNSSVVLGALSILRLTGLVCMVDGNRVALSLEHLKASPMPLPPAVQESVRRTIKFIKKIFHGVSRRYIQIYLAAYWCFFDRDRWTSEEVFRQCCRTKFQLRNFVSPLQLKLWSM